MLELSLLAVFIGGNESFRERKLQSAKVLESESSGELLGANDLGREKSIIQYYPGQSVTVLSLGLAFVRDILVSYCLWWSPLHESVGRMSLEYLSTPQICSTLH